MWEQPDSSLTFQMSSPCNDLFSSATRQATTQLSSFSRWEKDGYHGNKPRQCSLFRLPAKMRCLYSQTLSLMEKMRRCTALSVLFGNRADPFSPVRHREWGKSHRRLQPGHRLMGHQINWDWWAHALRHQSFSLINSTNYPAVPDVISPEPAKFFKPLAGGMCRWWNHSRIFCISGQRQLFVGFIN